MPTPNLPRRRRRKQKPRRTPGLSCSCSACRRRWRLNGGESETDSDARTEYESDSAVSSAGMPLSPKRARLLSDVAQRHGLAVNATGDAFDPERPQRSVQFDVPASFFRSSTGGPEGIESAALAAGWAVLPAGRVRAGAAAELLSPRRKPVHSGRSVSIRRRPEGVGSTGAEARAGGGGSGASRRSLRRSAARPEDRRIATRDIMAFIERAFRRLPRESRQRLSQAAQSVSSGGGIESSVRQMEHALEGHPELLNSFRELVPSRAPRRPAAATSR